MCVLRILSCFPCCYFIINGLILEFHCLSSVQILIRCMRFFFQDINKIESDNIHILCDSLAFCGMISLILVDRVP